MFLICFSKYTTERRFLMNPIILVAETGSDITPELAAKYHIRLVPMLFPSIRKRWMMEHSLFRKSVTTIMKPVSFPVPAEVHRKILSRSLMPFIRKTLRLRFSIWLILP